MRAVIPLLTRPILRRSVLGFLLVVPLAAAVAGSYGLAPRPDGSVEVTSPDGGRAVFAPHFTVLASEADPNLEMRWGKFEDPMLRLNDTGSIYNVLTWGSKGGAAAAGRHVEDGFDPTTDRGYGPGRTADLFAAGRATIRTGTAVTRRGDRLDWTLPADERLEITAELALPGDGGAPALTFRARARRAGWYSVGYTGAAEAGRGQVEELWQPLIWNERRLPEASYLEAGYRCPLPTTLLTRDGVTVGVVADPAEYPFQPLPNFQNSRFGVALRTREGGARPMLFAPLFGGAGSRMEAGETRAFTVRLFVARASLSRTYERIARELYGFRDYRHNALGSLNAAFDEMVEFGLSGHARFNRDLRGFAYDTDVPGAVKNVSALHPLGIALVTDRRDILDTLARPLTEFFVSRERFLFATDPKIKGQSTSSRLGGLGAPLTEYAALDAVTRGLTPFFRQSAEALFGRDRVLNLEGKSRGDSWSNALALYRATGDGRWLERARQDADAYLARRVAVRQTDYSDPDSRGLFFWVAFVPQWIELFELYDETKDPRYLAAAHEGARAYAQFVWLAPRIPDGTVTVNVGGLAPAYRTGARFPRIRVPEETVPAWRTSEIGLTSESAPTSKGARGILLACYAPWMLRIAALTDDAFLHDIARSAVIGRYTSFPGYHLNTARTTAYEKRDFARHTKDELNSATSIHYNHIWPHIALVLDYLVADAWAKSKGQVDFPGRYAEGYGYLQQRIYGDRPGQVYGTKGLRLWMPRGLVEVANPELNHLTARGPDSVALVLTNQSAQPAASRVRFDRSRLGGEERLPAAEIWVGNRAAGTVAVAADGSFEVTVPAGGIAAVVVRGVAPKAGLQDEFFRPAAALPGGSQDLGYREAKAVPLRFGGGQGLTSVYVYLPDVAREITACTLRWRQGGREEAVRDTSFPFDFTVMPDSDEPMEYWLEVELASGARETSPRGTVRLK